MAQAYEAMNLIDEALMVYDELDASFFQIQKGIFSLTTSAHLEPNRSNIELVSPVRRQRKRR